MDPDADLHPEMQNPGTGGGSAPNTPEELFKMQATFQKHNRPDKPVESDKITVKVRGALKFLDKLKLSAAENKEVALAIVRHLETYHDEETEELMESSLSKRCQVAAWAVDADRLMLCRIVLEGIEL